MRTLNYTRDSGIQTLTFSRTSKGWLGSFTFGEAGMSCENILSCGQVRHIRDAFLEGVRSFFTVI